MKRHQPHIEEELPHVSPAPGIESAINLEQWPPELRRAVMAAQPAFFAWPAADQLRYRMTLPSDAREADRMRAFIAEQHDDLVRNFDPKVVPLRRKRKVMLHPEAMRDMEDDGLS